MLCLGGEVTSRFLIIPYERMRGVFDERKELTYTVYCPLSFSDRKKQIRLCGVSRHGLPFTG